MADESYVTLKSLNCFTDLFKEATYPGHMLIRFWCDSDITFLRSLHTNLVTVLYFSINNVLCPSDGDGSFFFFCSLIFTLGCFTNDLRDSSLLSTSLSSLPSSASLYSLSVAMFSFFICGLLSLDLLTVEFVQPLFPSFLNVFSYFYSPSLLKFCINIARPPRTLIPSKDHILLSIMKLYY